MTDIPLSPSATVAVIIATRGRPQEVSVLLDMLARATRVPDQTVIVGSAPEDWVGAETSALNPILLASPEPGLPRQRNVGVCHLLTDARSRPEVIVFFDDDFRPEAHWLENALAVFAAHADVAGLTGVVPRDGAQTAAVSEAEAISAITAWSKPSGDPIAPVRRLYGCNMAVRSTVFPEAQFDEQLPLYGWLEDLDFSGQLGGRLVTAAACAGVHLGSKGARVSGLRFGYSQIVNPLFLARKGTCPWGLAIRLVVQGLASNTLRSIRRHPVFDYRGRLVGNLRALADMIAGKAHPERILSL